jgi:hypothetical protein
MSFVHSKRPGFLEEGDEERQCHDVRLSAICRQKRIVISDESAPAVIKREERLEWHR